MLPKIVSKQAFNSEKHLLSGEEKKEEIGTIIRLSLILWTHPTLTPPHLIGVLRIMECWVLIYQQYGKHQPEVFENLL